MLGLEYFPPIYQLELSNGNIFAGEADLIHKEVFGDDDRVTGYFAVWDVQIPRQKVGPINLSKLTVSLDSHSKSFLGNVLELLVAFSKQNVVDVDGNQAGKYQHKR